MKRVLATAMAVLAVVSGSLFAQSNPLVGIWKLNVEKSKYNPGPAPKSLTRTVEPNGDGVKYTFEGVAADGAAIAYGFAVSFDGKDNPVTGSMPNGANSIAAKRTSDDSFEATLKKDGKVVGTSVVKVSKDGKVTTVESKGTNTAGVKTHDVQVYDKQ
jgi:hypothetical protein